MAINRPATLTAKNLMNDLAEVINWDSFGVALGIKTHKLAEIRMNRHNELQSCKIALYDLWLRSDVNASWEKVEKALMDSDNEVQAKCIREKYLNSGRGSSKPKAVSIAAKGGSGGATGSGQRRPVLKIQAQPQPQPESHVMEIDTPTATVQQELVFTQNLMQRQPEDGEEDTMAAMITNLSNVQFDVNHVDPDDVNQQSLLHLAVQNKSIVTLKALIAFGAKVNYVNTFGVTPLDLAMMLGHTEAVKLLKEVGGKRRMELGDSYHMREDPAQRANDAMRAATNNVLVLDSSCSMALVQLELLNQIEVASNSKITDIFQWIVASGVGGLLMMFMIYGKKSIGDLRRLYFQLRERVFANDTGADKSKELESFVIEVLGDTMRMSETTEPKLLIGAVNKRTTHLDVKFFTNFIGDDDSRVHAWKVARYACSFPFVLGECDNFVDMGVLCKNPTDLALAKIRKYLTTNREGNIDAVVSLGDGLSPAEELGPVSLINFLNPDVYVNNLTPEAMSRIISVISLYRSAVNTLGRETASNHESEDPRHRSYQYFRFDPLLQDEIPASEDTSLDTLINVVFQTISYVLKDDGAQLSHLLTHINNPHT